MRKIFAPLALILLISACQQDPGTVVDPATIDGDAIIGWYAENGSSYDLPNTVTVRPFSADLPSTVKEGELASVDPKFATFRDKLAYATIGMEGYDTAGLEGPLVGMMVPDKFWHREIDAEYSFDNLLIRGRGDLDELRGLLGLESNERNTAIDSLGGIMSLGDQDIAFLSGTEILDYESAVEACAPDPAMLSQFEADASAFKAAHGDAWIRAKTFGFYCFEYQRIRINSSGSHSRDEVICALRLSYGMDRPLTAEEDLWMRWVLGRLSKNEAATNPELMAASPASTDLVRGGSICSSYRIPFYSMLEAARAAIAGGEIGDLLSSSTELAYQRY